MKNGFAIVAAKTATLYKDEAKTELRLDKNGERPIILIPVGGQIPNRNVLSGTAAANAGFQSNKTYLATYRETTPDEDYGRQFEWTMVQEIHSPIDVIDGCSKLGQPDVFNVLPEGQTEETSVHAKAQAATFPE